MGRYRDLKLIQSFQHNWLSEASATQPSALQTWFSTSVKDVQQQVRHKSETVALNQYGLQFPDGLGTITEAMSSALLVKNPSYPLPSVWLNLSGGQFLQASFRIAHSLRAKRNAESTSQCLFLRSHTRRGQHLRCDAPLLNHVRRRLRFLVHVPTTEHAPSPARRNRHRRYKNPHGNSFYVSRHERARIPLFLRRVPYFTFCQTKPCKLSLAGTTWKRSQSRS